MVYTLWEVGTKNIYTYLKESEQKHGEIDG
jgi:hypothetical protein